MEIILKYAASLDGYLNDNSENRYIFSSPADLEAVDKLRSEADAILVGAETLRSDNPSLKVKSINNLKKRLDKNLPEQPIRLCISRDNNLTKELQFFDKTTKSHVISSKFNESLKEYQIKSSDRLDAIEITNLIKDLGVKRLLVEGGVETHNLFLKSNLPIKLRISLAPLYLGESGVNRITVDNNFRLKLLDQRRLGDNIILWFSR